MDIGADGQNAADHTQSVDADADGQNATDHTQYGDLIVTPENEETGVYQETMRKVEEPADVTTALDDYTPLPALDDDEPGLAADDVHEIEAEDARRPADFDDEDADQTFEPEAEPEQQPKKQQLTKANSRRKRKSDVIEAEPEAARESPIAKKTRRNPTTDPPPKKSSANTSTSSSSSGAKGKKRTALTAKNSNAKLPEQMQKEVDDVVEKIPPRPGQNRSLYLFRKETPFDGGIAHTRSGRMSVKPLAYWRGERCIYVEGDDAPALADGARFPVNSIKEIVRTEEVESSRSKPKSKNKGKRGKSKAKNLDEDADSSDSGDAAGDRNAEPWESEIGTFRGRVSIWDSELQAPIEEEAEVDLAYAAAAIQTREIKSTSDLPGPTFKYAKLLSTKFFGTGIVDLPPGGIKRPKNSRRMLMSFFVVQGRVTVQVGPIGEQDGQSRFSIGKGGFWQVPRGMWLEYCACRKRRTDYCREPILH